MEDNRSEFCSGHKMAATIDELATKKETLNICKKRRSLSTLATIRGGNGIFISLLISSLMVMILSLNIATKTTAGFIQVVEANSLNSAQQQPNRQHFGSNAHQSVVSSSSASGGAGYNNFDNLISDFLDDAGNRLKKSKLNSMRQIKPTLRFGRRSDPLMSPTLADQLAMIDGEDPYESDQRKLLAVALASAEDN